MQACTALQTAISTKPESAVVVIITLVWTWFDCCLWWPLVSYLTSLSLSFPSGREDILQGVFTRRKWTIAWTTARMVAVSCGPSEISSCYCWYYLIFLPQRWERLMKHQSAQRFTGTVSSSTEPESSPCKCLCGSIPLFSSFASELIEIQGGPAFCLALLFPLALSSQLQTAEQSTP